MPHILIIDDEEQIREMLTHALSVHAYRVTAVATAAAALQVVRADAPDMIITDLQLEESDGFELIDELTAIAPKIPVMLLTGVLFDPEVTAHLDERHIAAYVEKTSSLERILSEVRRVLAAK